MKVLHLIGGGDVGGAKVHVLSLVNELRKHINVKIISFRHGAFADEAKALGIDLEVIKTGNIIGDIKKVIDMIKKENYQIIHAHGAKANMVAFFVKKYTSLPTVTTVHSDYRLDYMNNIIKHLTYGTINSFALRFINYHIGVSDNYKHMLIDRKFNPNKIYTVYNGMDFDAPTKDYTKETLNKKCHYTFKDNDIIVGIAARFHPVKDLGTLINAASIVVKKNPCVKFILGGDGDQRKYLEQKVLSLGLSTHIFFPGWFEDPYELISCLDINVQTSLSESFSFYILEGAKFKKATISSKVGGIPELIESGVNGYLFEPQDTQKLAEYILELAADGKKRKDMGELLFQKASTVFSLKNMCSTQLEIYQHILDTTAIIKKTGKLYDIIISGYYGFNNIGDDALLQAIISTLRLYEKNIRVLVFSNNPMETKQLYGVNAVSRFNILKIFSAMKQARIFVYGGGSLIQESTSTRSLVYYLGTLWMAKKANLKVMLYANGIEPINKKFNRMLTRKTINAVDAITLREEPSSKELLSLGIHSPAITVTSDPALMIEAVSEADIHQLFEIEGIPLDGPYIGFSVRKWAGRSEYVHTIARLADYMIEKHHVKPVFIPMQYPHDLEIIKNITSLMKGKGYIIHHRYSVNHVLGIIQKMDILIGMRLHALVFAASAGVPMVGLVYQPKVEWFLQYLGQGNASAGDVQCLDYDHVLSIVERVWKERKTIRLEIEKNIVDLKEKAASNGKIAIKLMNS